MKRFLGCWALAALLLASAACSRDGAHHDQHASFNDKQVLLARLPAGYEAGEVVFSSDGRHAAVSAASNGATVVVFDGNTSKAYDSVRDIAIHQGHDDHAFVARKGDREFVVLNGAEGTPYDAVTAPFFALDGRIVYAGRLKDKWVAVWGERQSAPFAAQAPAPAVSADGKFLVLAVTNPVTGKSRARIWSSSFKDAVDGEEYDAITGFHSDSTRPFIVYLAQSVGKTRVVTLDLTAGKTATEAGPWFDEIPLFGVSTGAAHVAYLARFGRGMVLVRDKAEASVPALESCFNMAVSGTGRVIYTGMLKGRVRLFLDGKPAKTEADSMEAPVFSSDGSHYACAVTVGQKSFVMVDGMEGPALDKVVTPSFAPGGSRLVYRARSAGQRFVVVADLKGKTVKESPREASVWDVSFSADGKKAGYGTMVGPELWWRVEPL